MKFIKKNKAVIIFYLVIIVLTLIYSNDVKQYNKKSISAGIEITDIQK